MKAVLWHRPCLRILAALPLLAPIHALQAKPHPQPRSPRLVFAHYMLSNQDYASDDPTGERSIASYEREVQQAQAVGIDGFALNAGGWLREPRYIRRASEMFEAAYRLHSNFKLLFSADMCCAMDADDVEDMVRRFANNPRYAPVVFRHNDKVVVTTFAGSNRGLEFWQTLRHDLETGEHPSLHVASASFEYSGGVPSSAPMQLFLVPSFFWGGETPKQSDIRTGLATYKEILDGALYWGVAGVPGMGHLPDQLPSSEAYATELHADGKLYMAPICFQFWGANAARYYEYSGYSGMRRMWMDAIKVSHPEWVELITWNDFIEGTYVSPIDDPARYPDNDLGASIAPPSTLHFFHSHRGATELLAYFIAWYKTGHQPAIRTDQVYWAYRTQIMNRQVEGEPKIKIYGNVKNVVYITANLTASAALRMSIGPVTRSVDLPAGSSDVEMPLVAGPAPHFELVCKDSRRAQGSGDDPISTSGLYPNFYYSTGMMRP